MSQGSLAPPEKFTSRCCVRYSHPCAGVFVAVMHGVAAAASFDFTEGKLFDVELRDVECRCTMRRTP